MSDENNCPVHAKFSCTVQLIVILIFKLANFAQKVLYYVIIFEIFSLCQILAANINYIINFIV